MGMAKVDAFDRVTGILGSDGSPARIACSRGPARARYFYRLRDDRMTEFCIMGAVGPQSVETLSPDGNHRPWKGYWDGDLLVFYPPDGADIADGIFWAYDKRLQVGEPCDRNELERLALRMRTSVVVSESMKDVVGNPPAA